MMARYKLEACSYGWRIKDTFENTVLLEREVIKLLNAHDGMMTREQVEKEIDFLGNDCTGLDRIVKQAYQTVLKGGTK